ncbi:MAG: acetyl-CoA carboxylase, carboxyltransferase subunit beta [Neomegalonema sp.]|nr:acetyl-CoA carboxylase, carboxyltransferase subunit beta [Neomegalonema sp.]
MNWINNVALPKFNSFFQRREMPDNLWRKCGNCEQMIFHRELKEQLYVCGHCGHHMRISPRERLESLFDHGGYEQIETPEPIADPLNFRDEKRYTDRLREARKSTQEKEAMIAAYGPIGEAPCVVAVQDFSFMGGSMGMGVGDALLAAAEAAVEKKAPLIVFTAAGGARMQEGILSLMQMPRSTIAVQMVQEAGLPYISIITHPTSGGVTASFAMLGDVQIAEPNALICFAGPRVIEQTIREKLPEGFQRSEYLLEHGMLDMVADRRELRGELVKAIRMLLKLPQLPAGALPEPGSLVRDEDEEIATNALPAPEAEIQAKAAE